jgi:hypothetical protein
VHKLINRAQLQISRTRITRHQTSDADLSNAHHSATDLSLYACSKMRMATVREHIARKRVITWGGAPDGDDRASPCSRPCSALRAAGSENKLPPCSALRAAGSSKRAAKDNKRSEQSSAPKSLSKKRRQRTHGECASCVPRISTVVHRYVTSTNLSIVHFNQSCTCTLSAYMSDVHGYAST